MPFFRNWPTSRSIWGWCVAFAGCAYLASVVATPQSGDPFTSGSTLHRLINAGAFNLLAWPMLFGRVRSFGRYPARPAAILLAACIGLLCAIPVGAMPAVALVLFGLARWARRAGSAAAREAAMLALALGASIGSPYARFLHLAISRLDAHVVAGMMRLAGVPVHVAGNLISYGNFSIEVLAACASSAPLAGCVLAYVLIAIYLRGAPGIADLPWLLGSLATSVVLTELRLSLMVPSEANWNFWHNGWGLTFYEIAALLLAGLFPVLASLRSARGAALSGQAA